MCYSLFWSVRSQSRHQNRICRHLVSNRTQLGYTNYWTIHITWNMCKIQDSKSNLKMWTSWHSCRSEAQVHDLLISLQSTDPEHLSREQVSMIFKICIASSYTWNLCCLHPWKFINVATCEDVLYVWRKRQELFGEPSLVQKRHTNAT